MINPAPEAPGSRAKTARRAAGILLHPTSFPGRYGIGELGKESYEFIEYLEEAGQHLWQVMPLGPTGYGNSPYSALSAFAGNPMLISLDELKHAGLLDASDLQDIPSFPEDRVDFGTVVPWKHARFRKAFAEWKASRDASDGRRFESFRSANAAWLESFCLYTSLKRENAERSWSQWPESLKRRDASALDAARERLADELEFHAFLQYIFAAQWGRLKEHARARRIRIIGDIPIFVAHDSADVWSLPDLFFLDEDREPTVVAGVPPDYFSATGQRWGNPLYRWSRMSEDGYGWWISRFRSVTEHVDIVRLDHFRGFEAYWEIPSSEPTAVKGRWIKGPGIEFFTALKNACPGVEIIAEDLGTITADVELLRESAGFPGMRVLQFAFGDDSSNPYLPHNYDVDSVAYTGTHDNDTSQGWFATASPKEKANLRMYINGDDDAVHFALIRLAYASVARFAIVPLQDILGLGTEARMNYPGKLEGNWEWRYRNGSLTDESARNLREWAAIYGRKR